MSVRQLTLRTRLALLYALLAAAILVVAYVVTGANLEGALISSTADRLEVEAGLVVADAAGGRRATAVDLAASDLAQVLGGFGTAVVILDGNGVPLAAEANGAQAAVAGARLSAAEYATVVASEQPMRAIRSMPEGGRVLVVAAPVELRTTGRPGNPGQGNGLGLGNQKPGKGQPEPASGPANAVAQLSISVGPIDAEIAEVRWRLLVVGLVVLVLAALAAWLITWVAMRPLARVAAAAGRIAGGDLAARASIEMSDSEVGRLGRAFDHMAERVDATLRAQRAFAADASHELRSPLTVLGGYVDLLARADTSEDARARSLEAMRREIDRLSRLSSDLLLVTQLEAGGGRLDPRLMDLGELVEDIGAAARVLGPANSIVVVRDGRLPVLADPDRVTQALMNLVDNAIRHSAPGGEVRITAEREGTDAVVAVSNDGQPISGDDLPRLFDRFYRGTPASQAVQASPSTGHAGLGLAIVKAIAEASGGSVAATSESGRTRFLFRLPMTA